MGKIIKKVCVLLFYFVVFYSCSSLKPLDNNKKFRITKIEQKEENLYVIYARQSRNRSKFKIVSYKSNTEPCEHCVKLVRGRRYNLTLHSGLMRMYESAPINSDGVRLFSAHMWLNSCFQFGEDTFLCIDTKRGI